MSDTNKKQSTNNYVSRRKSFHFSQKNDDLLQHLNAQEMDQTAYIMSLIRKDKEEKESRHSEGDTPSEILELKSQLDEALLEIKNLKEELPNMVIKSEVEHTSSSSENETMSFILQMLSEIKRDTEGLKSMVKNAELRSSDVEDEILETEQALSEDDFFDLACGIDLTPSDDSDDDNPFASNGFGFNFQ